MDGLARMVAFHADGKGNFLSIEKPGQGDQARRPAPDDRHDGNHEPEILRPVREQRRVRAQVKELFGESSGVKEAKDGAAQFKAVAEALRQRFNRGGGQIGQLEDWGMPHHHSQLNVAKAGREQWIADILPKLDRKRYTGPDGAPMTDQELNVFPDACLGDHRDRRHQQDRAGPPERQRHARQSRQRGAANPFQGRRQLPRISSEVRRSHPYEVMIGHISGVAKDIALVETLGPNPDHAFRMFRDIAIKEATLADPANSGKVQKQAVGLENLYNMTAGKTLPVASEWLAKSFDTLRSWLTASRLGSAVISSLSDEATLYLTAHVNNLPEMRLFANKLAALNPANQMEKRMALRAGLAMNTFISSLNRFGQEGLGASFSSKLASTVLRASGLNALTDARKRAFGVTMMSSLGQITRDFDGLARWIPPTIASCCRRASPRPTSPSGAKRSSKTGRQQSHHADAGVDLSIPDRSARRAGRRHVPQHAGRRPRAEGARRDPLARRRARRTDVAVIEPGVKERTLMMANLQRGTWKGELARSFFLFKSFPSR